jgi:hypothetical protein
VLQCFWNGFSHACVGLDVQQQHGLTCHAIHNRTPPPIYRYARNHVQTEKDTLSAKQQMTAVLLKRMEDEATDELTLVEAEETNVGGANSKVGGGAEDVGGGGGGGNGVGGGNGDGGAARPLPFAAAAASKWKAAGGKVPAAMPPNLTASSRIRT